MLSKPIHYSVCLCTRKCHRSHTSMESLMLILMIVLAISDSISSHIDPTASMHFKEPEKVSYNHSVTPNQTFENSMPSLTYELLDSTTTSPLSIHGAVVETLHDSSSFIRITSSQTTKQSMFMMQSEKITPTETPEITETFKLERPNPFKLSSTKVGNHVPIFTYIDQLSSFTQLPYSKVLEAQDLQSNLQTSSGTETVSATGIFSIIKPPVTSSSVAYFYLDVQSLSSSISKNLSTDRLQLQSTASRTNTEAQTLADLPTSPSTAAVFRTKTDTTAIFATKISGSLIKKTTTSLLTLETATETILPDKISNTKLLTTNTITTPLPATKAITEAILPTNTVTFEQLSTKTSAIVASSAAKTTVEAILPTKIITEAELSTKTPSTVTTAAKTTVEAILPIKTVTAAVLSTKTSSTVTSAAKTTVEAILPTKIITAAVLSTKTSFTLTLPASETTTEAILPAKNVTAAVLSTKPSSIVTLPATKTTTEAILPTKTVTAAVLSTKPSSIVTLSATKTTTEAILPTKTVTAAVLSTKPSSAVTLPATKRTTEAILPSKTVTTAVLSTNPSSTVTFSATKTNTEAILPTKTVTAALLSTKTSSTLTLSTTKTTNKAILPTKTVTAAVLSTKPSYAETLSATKTTTEAILPTKTVTAAVLSTKPSSTVTLSATMTTNKAILPTKTVTAAVLSTKTSYAVTFSATKTNTEAILPTKTVTVAVLSTKTSYAVTFSATKTNTEAILPTKTVTAAVLSTKPSSTVTLSATMTTNKAILPTKTVTAAVLSTKTSYAETLSATKTNTEAILPTKTVTAAVLSTKTSSTLTLSTTKTTNKAILPAKTVTAAVLSTKTSSTVTLSATKTTTEAILPTKTVTAAVLSTKTSSTVTLSATMTTNKAILPTKTVTAAVLSTKTSYAETLSATKTTTEAILPTKTVTAAVLSTKTSSTLTLSTTKTTNKAILPAKTVTAAVLSTKTSSTVTLSATKTTTEAILPTKTVTAAVLSTKPSSIVTLSATKKTTEAILPTKTVTAAVLSTKPSSIVTLPATKRTTEAILPSKTVTAAVLSTNPSSTVTLSATKTNTEAILPTKTVTAALLSTKTTSTLTLSTTKTTNKAILTTMTVTAAVLSTKPSSTVTLSATKTTNKAILLTKTVTAAVLSTKTSYAETLSATKTTTEAILPTKTVTAALLSTKTTSTLTLSTTKTTNKAILTTKTVTAAVLSTKPSSTVTLSATKTTNKAILLTKTVTAAVLSTKTSYAETLSATKTTTEAILPTKTVTAALLSTKTSSTLTLSVTKTTNKAILPTKTVSAAVLSTKPSSTVTLSATKTISEAILPSKTVSAAVISAKTLSVVTLPATETTSEQKLFPKSATAAVKSLNQTATVTLPATKTTSEAKLHTQIVGAAEFSLKPLPIVTFPVTKTITEAIMPANTVTAAVLSTKMLSVVTLSATKTPSEAILSAITVTTEVLSTNTPSVVTLTAKKTTSGTMLSAKSVTAVLLSTKILSVVTLPATKTTSEANLYTKTAAAAVLSIKQSATVTLATKTTLTPTIVKLSASKKTYDEIQPTKTVYAAVLPAKTPFVVKLSATKTIEAILPTKTVIAAVLSLKPLSSVTLSATKTTTEAILPTKTVNAAVLSPKKSFVVTLSATKSTSEAILPAKTVTAAVLSTKTLSVVTLTVTKTTSEAKLPAKTAIKSTKTSSTVTLPATWKSADAILPTKTVSATVLDINKSTTALLVTKALLASETASKSVLPTKTSNAAMFPTKTLSKTLLSTKILTATVLPQNKSTSDTRRITSSIFEHFSNYFLSFSTSTLATDAQWWQTERQLMSQEKLPTPSSIRLLNLQKQRSTNTMMLETLQLSPSKTKPLQKDGEIVLFMSLLNMPMLKSESSGRNTESPVWQPTLIKMSASIQPMTYSPEETFSTAQTLSTVTTLLPSSEVTFSGHIPPSSMQQLTTEKSRQPLSYKDTEQRDLDLQSIPLARTMFTDMKEIATSFDEYIDSSNTLSAELSNLLPSDVELEVSEQLTRYLISSVMTYKAATKQSSSYREVTPGYQTTELELETGLSGLVYSSSSASELTVPEPEILLTPSLLAHVSKILDQPSSFMDITDYETIHLRQTSSVESLTGTTILKSIINARLSTPSKSSTRATIIDTSQNISSYTMSVITQQKRMPSLSAWSVLIERTKLSPDPGVSTSAGTQFTGSAGILTQSTDVLQLSTSFTTNTVSELQRQPKATAKSVLLNVPHLISSSSSYISHIDSNSFPASIVVAVSSLFTDLSMFGSYAMSSSYSTDVLKDNFQQTLSSLTKSVDSEQDMLSPKPSHTLNSISSAPRLSPPRTDKVSQSEGSLTQSVGTPLTEEPHVSPSTVSKPLTPLREHTGSLSTTVQVSPVSFTSILSELQIQNQVHVSLGTTLLGTPQLLSPYAVPTLKGSYTETLIKGISQLSPSVTMHIAQGLETLSPKPLEPLSIDTRLKITPHMLSKFAVIIFSELQGISYTVTSGTTRSPTSIIRPLLSEQDEKGIFPAYIDGVVSSSLNKQLFSELGSISPASTDKYLTDIVQFTSLPLSRIEEDNAYPRSTPSIHKPHISTPYIHLMSSEPNYLSVAFTELFSDNSHIGPTFTSVDYTVSNGKVFHSTPTTTFLTSTILSSSFSEPDGAFLSSIITDLTDSEVDSYSITELTLLESEITSPSTSDLIHNDIRNVAPLITKNRVSDSSWPIYLSHLSPSFTEVEVLKSDISFSNTASKFNAMLLLSPLKFEEPKIFSTTDAASMLKFVSKTSQPVTEYTGLESGVASLAETVAMSTQLSRLIQSFIEFSVSGTKGIFSTASTSVLTAMPNPSLSFTDLTVPKPESASSVTIEPSTPYIKRFTISLNDKMGSQLKYRSTTPISIMSNNVEHLSLITKRMLLESDSILLSSTGTSKTEKPTLSASFTESNIFASKSATSATVASMITERKKSSTFTFKQSESISSPATSFMLKAIPNFSLTFSQFSVLEPESSFKTIASLFAVTPTLSLFKFNEPQSTPLAAAESVLLDPLKPTSSFSELTATKSISSSATTVMPKQPSFEVMESETVFPAAAASMFKGIPKLASSFPDLTAFKTDVVFLSTITSKLRDILKTKEPVIDSHGETSSTGLIDAVLTHINQLSSYTSLTISDSNRLFLTTTGKSIRDISMLSVPRPQLSSPYPEFAVLEPEHSFSTTTLSLSTDIISPVTDLTITDRKSSLSASTASKSIGIPIVTPSFSEFTVLKPGNSSSVATSILAYMPELLSSIIDFSNLEQESISPAGTTLAVTNQPKNFISFDRVKALEQDSLTTTAFLTDISQSSSFTNLTVKESRVSTPAASASLLKDIPKLSSTFTEFMTLVLENSSLDASALVTSDVQNFSSTLGEFTVFESESSSRAVPTIPSGLQKLSSSFSKLMDTELDYLSPDATASYYMFTSIQNLSSLLKEFVIKESDASVPTFTNTPILSSSLSEFLVLKPVLVPKTSTSVPNDIRKITVSFTEKVLSYKQTQSLEKSSDNIIVTEMPLQETVKVTRTLLPYTTSFEVSTSFDMEMQALDTSSLSVGKTPIETSPTSSSIKVAPISPMDHMPKETLSFLLPKTVEAAALLSLRPESLPTDVFTLKAADTLKSYEIVLLLESVSQPSSIKEIEISETPELLPGAISEGLKDQLSTIMNNRISENHYSSLISSEATFDELTQSSSSTRNLISGTSSGNLLQTRHKVTLSSSYFDHFSVSKLDLSLFSKHTGNTNSTPTIVVHELPVSVLKEEALPVSKEDITLRYLSMVNASDLVMSIVSTTPALLPTINSQFVSMLSKENQHFSISTEWLHPSSLSRLYTQRVSGATDILPSSTFSTIDTLSFLVPAVFLASVSKRHFSTTAKLAAPASDISTKETISSILESSGISSLGRYTTSVKLLPTRTEAALSISSSKSDIGQATLSLSSELIATFIQFKTDILSSMASSFTSSSSFQSSFVGPHYAALNTVAVSQVATLVTTSVTSLPSLPSLQYSMTEEPNNSSLKVFGKEESLLFSTVSARQSTKAKLESEILHTPAAVDLSLLSSGIRPTRVSSFSKTAIFPSRKIISFPFTSMKTKYLSSLQQTPLLSLRWDETTKSEMNSLFRKVHASTSMGSSSMDEMVSPVSIPDTSASVSADFFSPSSVVTPGWTSIYTTRTKSPPYKIDIVTSLTIGILVKTETDIRSKTFELNIKAGLRRCYDEGIAKYSETGQRRERAVSNVTIKVTDMERNSQRPTHVDVEFYVQLDGISQLAIQVLATFSRLSVAETSAYLSYPVIVPIKSVSNTATQKPTDRDEANVPSMTYAMIGVPSVSAVIAAVVLIVWYCQKGDHRLKQHGSRLADADLKIDIEKGEVVSASVSRNENIYRFAFDKGVGNLNRNLKQVGKAMNKAYGYQEGCMALKRSESAMNSASQRLEWLRKLGFRGSDIRKHGIESIDACGDNSECSQRCNIFSDHCVINDLNKPTDSRIDLSQTEFKHDLFTEDDVALLQKQNDIQIHTFKDADVSPSINKETSQLGLNIKPRRHGSISNKRKLIKRLSYNSSDSDMEIGDSKSIHSIRLKRRSENRKKRKLKQGGKNKTVQNTTGKKNGIYNLVQGEVQSLKPRVPSLPSEGHCCKMMREPLYTSLTLGKEPPPVNNFEEGDLEDEVFLADNIQYTDLRSKEDRTFGKCISDANKVSSDLTNRQVRQKQTKSSFVNHCDIIRSCDSNNYSFLQGELNQKDTGRDMVQISCDSIKSMFDSYLEHWLDDPFYLTTCCDNLTDGSEYAGHEFESLNFTKEYTNLERNQRCGPHPVEDTTQHSNMADGLIEYRNGPGVCEHVTKMGRFSKNHGALHPKKDFGPQFRKLPFQEQSFPSTKSSTPEPPPSPKRKDSDLRQLRFIIPKKEIMKEIGIQTVELVPDFKETLNKRDNKPYIKDRDTKFDISESMDVHMGGGANGKKSYTERAHVLENGIRTRDTNIDVVKFPSKRENGAHAIDIDHTVAQDHEVSKLEQTTGKRTDAERELRFNNETGKRSASQNMEKRPLKKKISLFDIYTANQKLTAVSNDKSIAEASTVTRKKTISGREPHLDDDLERKDTSDDKEILPERKKNGSQYRNGVDMEVNRVPKYEEVAKIENITGKKTAYEREKISKSEPGREASPQELETEPQQKEDTPQDADTFSQKVDEITHYEDISKVEHTTGGKTTFERGYTPENGPGSGDKPLENEKMRPKSRKNNSRKQEPILTNEPVRTNQRHVFSSSNVEMKLGRNMRAAPKGSIAPRKPTPDLDQQLLDATEPLLHNQSLPSNNIAEYYANTQPALPQLKSQGAAIASRLYPARSMTCPQHPSQHLIETLNRNSQTSLTNKSHLEDEQRKEREEEFEKYKKDLEARERHEQSFDTDNTLLKESFVLENEPNMKPSTDIMSPPPPPLVDLYSSYRKQENYFVEPKPSDIVSIQPFSPQNSTTFNQGGESSATTSSLQETVTYSEVRVQNMKQETDEEVEEDIAEDIDVEEEEDSEDGKIKDEDFNF